MSAEDLFENIENSLVFIMFFFVFSSFSVIFQTDDHKRKDSLELMKRSMRTHETSAR